MYRCSNMVGHFQEFEDEYLETMYEFHEREPLGLVRTGDLASRLGVSPASATEMVQRLAARGLLEYLPYKGTRLTLEGLEHGRKMKRRHRLAEVLLDVLPYDGDAHETACRLEHAIDDDMEVALSRLVSMDALDPSGKPIPPPTDDIAQRLAEGSRYVTASLLNPDEKGAISAILLAHDIQVELAQVGVGIGAIVSRDQQRLIVHGGGSVMVSDEWMKAIFLKPLNKIA